ncbi:MAG: hypothetical protein RLP44_10555 [Aggregatilineales bacterium]
MNRKHVFLALIIFALTILLASCDYFSPARSSIPTNEVLAQLDDMGEVTAIDWRSDGTQLLIGSVDQLYIYDVESDTLTQLNWSGGGPVTDVAWQPMGQMIVATNSPDVELWDSETRAVQISLESHIQYRIFNSAAWSPSGDILAVTSSGTAPRGMVRFYDTSDFHVIHTIASDLSQIEQVGYSDLAFSPHDSNQVAFANMGNHRIEVWNTTDWELVLELAGHEATITSLSWHGQNSWLASSDRNGSVIIWDVSTGQEIDRYAVSSTLTALDWKPSEDVLAVSSDDGVLLWNLSENTTVELLGESANDVSWSPDGNLLATALRDGVIILDMVTDEQ